MKKILVDRGSSSHGQGEYADYEDNTQVWDDLMQAMGLLDPPTGDMTAATRCAIAYCTMKLSRLSANPNHEDSWIDLANYAVLALAIQRRTRHMRGIKSIGVHDNTIPLVGGGRGATLGEPINNR